MAYSDAELIKRTLDGDETAFGFLVDKYKGGVHALAFRKVGNFHTAEDITQDTFLKAFQKLSTLKDWEHFPGWLYTIAARFCLMWHRKRRLPTQPLDTAEMGLNALAAAKFTDEQTRQAVHDALEELPESQRTVLTLHYLGGMTCAEIARFIGTSRGAVLDRLHRARAQLKKELIQMIKQTLGAFQLPPSFTQHTMNRIEHVPSTPTPQSKPILPWLSAAVTLVVVTLFIGFGQRSMMRFQQPYSLDAPEPTVRVDLIDAPVIHLPDTKPALINRPGRLNARDDKHRTQPDGAAVAAATNAESGKGLNDTDWTQTNGPYGGSVDELFRASDGTLYATINSSGVFRSSNGGDSWVPVNNGLEVYVDGSLPSTLAITEANGVLYLSTTSEFFYSTNRGESWRWVKYPERNPKSMEIRGFSVVGARIYISRLNDRVVYSDDYGASWMPLHDGLPAEPPDRLMTVGTTLFAKTGDELFRLKAGETSWTRIARVQKLHFFTATERALIIGSQTDLRRSTDEGDTWTPMTPELENQSIKIEGIGMFEGIAVFGGTIYAILNNGKLLCSTDNGWSWARTEISGLDYQTVDSMVALSEHVVCIGGDGVFRWRTGEKSWRRINEGLICTMVRDLVFFKNALYVTTYNRNGIFKSVDGGNSWIPIHQGLPTIDAWELTVAGRTLYLGVNEMNFRGTQEATTVGIYRLADDQNSWIPVQTEMRTDDRDSNHEMRNIEQLAISGDTFYAIGSTDKGYRLFRWRRGKRFWTDISPDTTDWIYLGQDDLKGLTVAGKTLYISAGKDLMRSRNKGNTWSEIEIPTPRYGQNYGTVVLGKTVYTGVSRWGVFRSTDRGKTWESVNEGLPSAYSWAVYPVGNTLYATRTDEGIFRLKDGRDSWEFVKPSPARMLPIGPLAVAGTTLYAGTGSQGVYRIELDD